ncbi:hypothetical protein DS901_07990 [Loktanella sp. D2R18]|uniref:DUF7742 family protein n=1 Tax=Rhodobacterales TaxID=204455 RepID=UPI000DEAE208|nr:hypothetical protein [Yoonia sp. 1_MG-2023]RBW44337.1 hypothetical protein DS901_07990 [Loktanella sp. D2R18]
MRPVQLADLETAARVVAASPARQAMIAKLCAQADQADAYRIAQGKPHPQFGNGTLMSAALKYDESVARGPCNKGFLRSLAALCTYLADNHTS